METMIGAAEVEEIRHSADVGLRVRADSAQSAFEAIAAAMFQMMVDRDSVEPAQSWSAHVDGDGWQELLVAWLEELLYCFESEALLVHDCRITSISEDAVRAELRGEPLNPDRHELRQEIRGVLYHQLRARETPEGFQAQVLLDT